MGLLNIFPHITGIGDSLMAGYHIDNVYAIDNPIFSWLQYICNRNGIKLTNLSRGGLTAKSWIDIYSYFIMQESCPCYIIGLDGNDWEQNYIIGSIEDDLKANTFIGYYKEIINIILNHNPYAIIFCLSTYYNMTDKNKNGDTLQDFSKAKEEITKLYKNTYFVDFYRKSKFTMPNSGFDGQNHYDTLGYYKISEDIEEYLSEIIKNNIDDFKKIGLYNSFGIKYENIKNNF